MSERAGRRSRRSRTGEWKMTVRGALRPAAGPLGRPWGPVVRLAIRQSGPSRISFAPGRPRASECFRRRVVFLEWRKPAAQQGNGL
jgi:hypothetical protein